MILKLFNKKYPYFLNKREAFTVIGVVGVFVFLFCMIFRPFELSGYNTKELILISIVNALVIIISLSVSQVVFSFFIKNQDEENWTVLKEVISYLWHILILFLFTYLFNSYLNSEQINILEKLLFVGKRLLVASFIIGPLIILLKRNFILQKNNRHTSEIDKIIKTKVDKENDKSKKIKFSSNDKQKDLEIDIEQVIYFKASENYVEVSFFNNQEHRSVLLRNTLKNVLAQVEYNSSFFRCHRSYIINLSKVSSFSGNSRGYLVQFKNLSVKIPVSRSAIEDFKRRIKAYSSNI